MDNPNILDESSTEVPTPEIMSIEVAIKSCLQNFFGKRRASGDTRPCGPHGMDPIYQAVVGITKKDLKNENFLNRFRRSLEDRSWPVEREREECE